MTKSNYSPPSFIDQVDIIELNPWLNQLNKIHESKNPRIGEIHGYIGGLVKKSDKVTTHGKIIEDLSSIKNDPKKFSAAVNYIDEVYQDIFCREDAEIIPFKRKAVL